MLISGVNDVTGVVITGDKFITGVNDTREQLIAGVSNPGDEHSFANISAKVSGTFEMAPREYSWAQGTLFHEKNLKSKISCQTPFKSLKIPSAFLSGSGLSSVLCTVYCHAEGGGVDIVYSNSLPWNQSQKQLFKCGTFFASPFLDERTKKS
jgi:hypothetical protein